MQRDRVISNIKWELYSKWYFEDKKISFGLLLSRRALNESTKSYRGNPRWK